jgi:predicted nucleic acid-binding protein
MVSCILQENKARKVFSSISGVLVTSRLGRAEVIRTLHKVDPTRLSDAKDFLTGLTLIEVNSAVLEKVESYSSEITLKTSDAIHVATAELILSHNDLLITFDRQMSLNAEMLGLSVLTSS